MPKQTAALDLDVDLEGGVVPISKAASSLAALLKRARERRQPIIVTQKGYPAGVILDVELYVALRAHVDAVATRGDNAQIDMTPAPVEAPTAPEEVFVVTESPASTKARSRRRRKAQT
jgi:prevent-host-death family protein